MSKNFSKAESNMYGTCRCCLAKGNHRHISKEYIFKGCREVYMEIFLDCFNLFLSQSKSLSQLICNKCVTKLREAREFRAMVADAEMNMLNTLSESMDTEFINVAVEEAALEDTAPSVVKTELETQVKLEEPSDDEIDNELVSTGEVNDNHDQTNKPGSEYELVPGEAELLGRFSAGQVKRLPTRSTLYRICPEYSMQLDLIKNLVYTSRMVQTLQIPSEIIKTKSFVVSEKLAHITNASTLIQYSNLTPFKSRSRSGYPCFYCRNIFEDFNKLREHVSDHKPSEIFRVLKQFGTESLVVYAEVTDLKCNICNTSIPSINELKSHLAKVHQKKFYTEISDRVIPFKMKGLHFECQICGCNFETFGAVERHMNGHYRNYVCKECGSGYVTKYRLKVHVKSMHVDGVHPCEYCGKVFSTQQKHKNHVNTVHKLMKRFKCAKCPQRFTEYFRRQRHMEQIHGVTPLKYKCNVCDRAFDRRYTLSRHLKRDHLEERDYQCEICAYKCFTKNELKVHMVKHSGERIFECTVCKKSYARKKTLKEHMRIHNNDRRFACAVCGQAFVQKCSLKGHLKTHHLEYNVQ